MSSKSVLQECQIRVSRKSVLQECQVRVSHKSVKQECLTRALRNSVKQGCPTRVSPECVNSGCLTSEFAGNVTNKYCLCLSTYVSAFGFVGFILFSCDFLSLNRVPCLQTRPVQPATCLRLGSCSLPVLVLLLQSQIPFVEVFHRPFNY